MVLGVKNRHEITEFAYNGEEALNKVKHAVQNNDPYKYAIIMMDCNMPFMDGYDATKNIKKMYRSPDFDNSLEPQIFGVTGHVEKEYIIRALNNGMTKVFAKPLKMIEFGELLVRFNYIDKIPAHILHKGKI